MACAKALRQKHVMSEKQLRPARTGQVSKGRQCQWQRQMSESCLDLEGHEENFVFYREQKDLLITMTPGKGMV